MGNLTLLSEGGVWKEGYPERVHNKKNEKDRGFKG